MKPIGRDRRRGGRSRYRTASTDRASGPIDPPQQMVGWDMVFQAEVLELPLRRRLRPIIARLLEYRSEKTNSRLNDATAWNATIPACSRGRTELFSH